MKKTKQINKQNRGRERRDSSDEIRKFNENKLIRERNDSEVSMLPFWPTRCRHQYCQ